MAGDTLRDDLIPEAGLRGARSSFVRSRTKRVINVAISFVGLLLTIALTPFIAVLLKIDSRGPILYRQVRLGVDGQPFMLLKFRTMVHGAENEGEPIWASDDDPRITRVGGILRGLYIDELPQWWNVLKGEMSVLGPRPERPGLAELVVQSYPGFAGRLEAKPGITGLAQTEYKYTASVDDSRHKLSYDRKYIQKASLALDMWIILRTFRRMLLRSDT